MKGTGSNCAVVVHWGEKQTTIEAAARLVETELFETVVVVANDGKRRPAELTDGRILWVVPPRNLGFGAGCEFGAKACESRAPEKYAFLNPDVTMARDDCWACLEALDEAGIGVTGPLLIHPNGDVQSGAGSISRVLGMPIAHKTRV